MEFWRLALSRSAKVLRVPWLLPTWMAYVSGAWATGRGRPQLDMGLFLLGWGFAILVGYRMSSLHAFYDRKQNRMLVKEWTVDGNGTSNATRPRLGFIYNYVVLVAAVAFTVLWLPENTRLLALFLFFFGDQLVSAPLALGRGVLGDLGFALFAYWLMPLFGWNLQQNATAAASMPSFSWFPTDLQMIVVSAVILAVAASLILRYHRRGSQWQEGESSFPMGVDRGVLDLCTTAILLCGGIGVVLLNDYSGFSIRASLLYLVAASLLFFLRGYLHKQAGEEESFGTVSADSVGPTALATLPIYVVLLNPFGTRLILHGGWSALQLAVPFVVLTTLEAMILLEGRQRSAGSRNGDGSIPWQSEDQKVIIVGGGAGGLVTAACLEQMSVPYVVLEKRTEGYVEDGADLALWPSAIKALKTLHVADDFWARKTNRISSMQMREAETHGEVKLIDLDEVVAGSGEGFVLVSRSALMAAIRCLVPKEKIIYGATLTSVSCESPDLVACTVAFEGKPAETIQGRIVVAADGTYSACRRKFVDPSSSVRFKGEVCYRGIVDVDKSLSAEVKAVFEGLESGRMKLDLGQHTRSSVGFLSPDHKEGYWFVKQVSTTPARDLTPEDIERDVRSWPQNLQDLYDATENSKRYIHSVEDAEALDRWSRDRVVLLGDAAHPVTPNTAQGACLAVDDALALAVLFRRYCKQRLGHIDAFYYYEKRRKVHAAGVAAEARIQMMIQHLSLTFGSEFRNTVLRLAPTSALQKRLRKVNMHSTEDLLDSLVAYRSEQTPLLRA